jgi:hypothetical protein
LDELELPGLELVDPNADYSGTQTIFVDFDGAEGVSYDNEALNIHIGGLSVADSGLTEEEQSQILTSLNTTFAGTGVTFTATAPVNEEYSTIYVGGDGSAFAEYGSFHGLAETIDTGNQIKNDEAFVFSENITSTATITETIAHETGHLLGFGHEGEKISDSISSYALNSNTISEWITDQYVDLYDFEFEKSGFWPETFTFYNFCVPEGLVDELWLDNGIDILLNGDLLSPLGTNGRCLHDYSDRVGLYEDTIKLIVTENDSSTINVTAIMEALGLVDEETSATITTLETIAGFIETYGADQANAQFASGNIDKGLDFVHLNQQANALGHKLGIIGACLEGLTYTTGTITELVAYTSLYSAVQVQLALYALDALEKVGMGDPAYNEALGNVRNEMEALGDAGAWKDFIEAFEEKSGDIVSGGLSLLASIGLLATHATPAVAMVASGIKIAYNHFLTMSDRWENLRKASIAATIYEQSKAFVIGDDDITDYIEGRTQAAYFYFMDEVFADGEFEDWLTSIFNGEQTLQDPPDFIHAQILAEIEAEKTSWQFGDIAGGISQDAFEDIYEDDSLVENATLIGTSGYTQTHSFHVQEDVDWIKFNLNETTDISISTDGPDGGNTAIALYRGNNLSNPIAANDDRSANNLYSLISLTGDNALGAGEYYVKITNSGDTALNRYTVTINAGEPPPPSIPSSVADTSYGTGNSLYIFRIDPYENEEPPYIGTAAWALAEAFGVPATLFLSGTLERPYNISSSSDDILEVDSDQAGITIIAAGIYRGYADFDLSETGSIKAYGDARIGDSYLLGKGDGSIQLYLYSDSDIYSSYFEDIGVSVSGDSVLIKDSEFIDSTLNIGTNTVAYLAYNTFSDTKISDGNNIIALDNRFEGNISIDFDDPDIDLRYWIADNGAHATSTDITIKGSVDAYGYLLSFGQEKTRYNFNSPLLVGSTSNTTAELTLDNVELYGTGGASWLWVYGLLNGTDADIDLRGNSGAKLQINGKSLLNSGNITGYSNSTETQVFIYEGAESEFNDVSFSNVRSQIVGTSVFSGSAFDFCTLKLSTSGKVCLNNNTFNNFTLSVASTGLLSGSANNFTGTLTMNLEHGNVDMREFIAADGAHATSTDITIKGSVDAYGYLLSFGQDKTRYNFNSPLLVGSTSNTTAELTLDNVELYGTGGASWLKVYGLLNGTDADIDLRSNSRALLQIYGKSLLDSGNITGYCNSTETQVFIYEEAESEFNDVSFSNVRSQIVGTSVFSGSAFDSCTLKLSASGKVCLNNNTFNNFMLSVASTGLLSGSANNFTGTLTMNLEHGNVDMREFIAADGAHATSTDITINGYVDTYGYLLSFGQEKTRYNFSSPLYVGSASNATAELTLDNVELYGTGGISWLKVYGLLNGTDADIDLRSNSGARLDIYGKSLLDSGNITGCSNKYTGTQIFIYEGAESEFNDISFSEIDANIAGTALFENSSFDSSNVNITGGTSEFTWNSFNGSSINVSSGAIINMAHSSGTVNINLNAGATASIHGNDFSNAIISLAGNAEQQVDLSGNYWGTTDMTAILAKITEHSDKSTLPYVIIDSVLTYDPTEDTIAPTAPQALSANISVSSILLDWTDSGDDLSGISHYVVKYADNAELTDSVEVIADTSELAFPDSFENGTYYWQVMAVDNAGNESAWSAIDDFTIESYPAPGIPSGLDDSINGASVLLDWADSSGATKYNIQVDNNNDFSSPEFSGGWPSSSEFTVPDLADGTYYWRVQACNENGYSDWASGESFTIDATAPDVPESLISTLNGNDVLLDWSDSDDSLSGFDEYIVEYSTNADFSDAAVVRTDSSILELSDLEDAVYYWRVKAVDNNGNESEWSTADDFTVDLIQAGQLKLTASDGAAGDQFGYSVALDGDNIVIGSVTDDDNGSDSGSAYAYRWNGTSYDEYKLIASDGAEYDYFGYSISIDGDNIVAGAGGDDGGGSAYVYRWNGTDYDEYKLTASDGWISDEFGCSVAISGDTVVVGADASYINGILYVGSAYVYRWNGTSYNEYKLTASDGARYDFFGKSLAVDGDNIIVGAYRDGDNGDKSGSAYVYRWNGTSYDEYKLTASDGVENDYFGWYVDISGDNIVVGAVYDDIDNVSNVGSAYVYRWNGTSYDEYKLTASDGAADDQFGYSVAISGDNVVVGTAYDDNENGNDAGSVYIYHWNGLSFDEYKVTAPDGAAGDLFGYSVAIDGDSILIGAYSDDGNEENSGSAYVFTLSEIMDLTAPGVPSGLTHTVTGNSISSDWDDSTDLSGIQQYELQGSSSSDFSAEVTESYFMINSETTINGLEDGVYFYRVRAQDNAGNWSDYSETQSFTIDTAADVPANMDSAISGNGVTFSWDEVSDVSGVLRYEYYLDNDSDFSSPIAHSGTTETSFNVSDLADGTYYWKVCTCDNLHNYSDWSTVESFRFSSHRKNDFDGNSRSDVISYLSDTGHVKLYLNGTDSVEQKIVGGVDAASWDYVGTGDFNSDGATDVLWRNKDTGLVGAWLLDKGTGNYSSWSSIAGAAIGEWEISGVGDFNGDKTDDVLWYNTQSGLMGAWLVDNGVYSAWSGIAGADPSSWSFSGIGDFNNDNMDDILWCNNDTGLTGAWLLDNGTYSAWTSIAGADLDNWSLSGVGDFNADGTDDVLWCNKDTGLTGAWLLGNGAYSAWTSMAGADLNNWQLEGVGDYNGDGTDDVLWCNNDSGLLGYWQIENGQYTNWATIA